MQSGAMEQCPCYKVGMIGEVSIEGLTLKI